MEQVSLQKHDVIQTFIAATKTKENKSKSEYAPKKNA
jgi:hypothetical protein